MVRLLEGKGKVCGRFGLWKIWLVEDLACGRSDLWKIWFVEDLVCGRSSLPLQFFRGS
jgi:hypothetical protein